MANRRHTQAGFIQFIVLIIIAVVVIIGGLVIFLTIFVGGTTRQSKITNQPVVGSDNSDQAVVGSDDSKGSDDTKGDAQSDSTLLGLRQLRCVVLPGVDGIHTRALDVRVARGYWKPAYEEMQARNIKITINYGFRNVCEQIRATQNSGTNSKCHWASCVSNHMAGRAIDVNGIGGTQPDKKSEAAALANPVLQILRKYGWRWLGRKDWPHFDIEADKVNDSADNNQWVSEIQLFWKRQQERGGGALSGCIAGECGEFYSLMRKLPAFKRMEMSLTASKQ